MRIRACIKCGSIYLNFTPGDGSAILTKAGVGPLGGIAMCNKCGTLSAPIEFETEKAYKGFLAHLKKMNSPKTLNPKGTKTRFPGKKKGIKNDK
jgi:hypothetical protein